MSLINQMLQDLEKRKAESGLAESERAQYMNYSAPVSTNKQSLGRVALVLLGVLLLVWMYVRFQANGVTTSIMPSEKISPQPMSETIPQLSGLPLLLKMSPNISEPKSVAESTSGQASVVNGAPEHAPQVEVGTSRQETPSKNATVFDPQIGNASAQESAAKQSIQAPLMPTGQSARVDSRNQVQAERASETAPIMIKEVSPQQRAESEFKQATVYQQQGRNSEAIQVLQRALELDPLHMPARQMLVTLFLDAKRYDDASRELRTGLSIDLHQINFAMVLARILVERAKVNEAIEVLQKSVAFAQDRPDYLAFLAALQQKLDRHKEAISYYRLALARHAQNGVWWMGLAISLQAEGSNQEALEAYRQSKIQPGLGSDLIAFVDQRISQLQK